MFCFFIFLFFFFLQYYIRCNTHTYESTLEPDWGQYCWYPHAEIWAHTWFEKSIFFWQWPAWKPVNKNRIYSYKRDPCVKKTHHKFKVSSKIINVFITCTPWANFLHFSLPIGLKCIPSAFISFETRHALFFWFFVQNHNLLCSFFHIYFVAFRDLLHCICPLGHHVYHLSADVFKVMFILSVSVITTIL